MKQELSCLFGSSSLRSHGLQPTRLLFPRGFPDKNAGVGSNFLLQGIFLTQGLNPCLLRWQMNSLTVNHLGSNVTANYILDSKKVILKVIRCQSEKKYFLYIFKKSKNYIYIYYIQKLYILIHCLHMYIHTHTHTREGKRPRLHSQAVV